jgi:hypothetical protein
VELDLRAAELDVRQVSPPHRVPEALPVKHADPARTLPLSLFSNYRGRQLLPTLSASHPEKYDREYDKDQNNRTTRCCCYQRGLVGGQR